LSVNFVRFYPNFNAPRNLSETQDIKFIDFLHADRQTDMVKLIGQFLQNFDAKA